MVESRIISEVTTDQTGGPFKAPKMTPVEITEPRLGVNGEVEEKKIDIYPRLEYDVENSLRKLIEGGKQK